MANLILNGDTKIITTGLKFVTFKTKEDIKVHEVPIPKDEKNEPDKSKPVHCSVEGPPRILCGTASPCGGYLALCDDFKQITIWTMTDGVVKLLVTRFSVRRATKVIFTPDSKQILVADKSGDVYLYRVQDQHSHGSSDVSSDGGELLLGHLSFLLDLIMDPSGKFILTCDRDEKIRVSRFPNSYNIHNYCLGHLEFVTSLALIGSGLLVSGAGDGTCRLWEYMKGKEMACREVWKDVKDNVDEDAMDVDQKIDNIVDNKAHARAPTTPSVLAVKAVNIDATGRGFVIQIEGFVGLVLYQLKQNQEMIVKQKLTFECDVWDYQISKDGARLHVLTKPNDGQHPSVDIFKVFNDTFIKESKISFENEKQLFEEATKVDLGSSQLHKRWFDNVGEYMKRKEARLEQGKAPGRSSQPPKKKLYTEPEAGNL